VVTPSGSSKSGLAGVLPPLHQVPEQSGRLKANLGVPGTHTGQGRAADFAQRFVIIHPDDRDLVGHAGVGPAAGFEELGPALIAADHHAHRFGQAADPAGQIQLHPLPGAHVRRVSGQLIALKRATRLANRLRKRVPSLLGPVLSLNPDKGELPEAAFEQVPGSHPGDGRVLDVDQGKERRHHAEHVHDRNAEGLDLFGQGAILDASDGAIAPPAPQPARGQFLEAAGLVVQGPGLVLADETGDAAEDIPARCEGGLDQQRNVAPGLLSDAVLQHRRVAGFLSRDKPATHTR
jgi:hypothetical protein